MKNMLLSIPKPCHENWDKMSPTEQGRFCNTCAKQVVDFSTMSDKEVLNFFNKSTTGNVCGRVYTDQLHRPISFPEPVKRKKFCYWNYMAMLFLFFTKSGAATAQDTGKPKTTILDEKAERLLKGKVINEKGEPLAFASVVIHALKRGVAADAEGRFSIAAKKGDVIAFSSVGYAEKIYMAGEDFSDELVITLEPRLLVGEIVYTRPLDMESYPEKEKHVEVIVVKDSETKKVIPGASITIKNYRNDKEITAVVNSQGQHKLKRITDEDTYDVKISAPGYTDNSFTIDGSRLQDRKIVQDVYLSRIPAFTMKTMGASALGKEIKIRMGGMNSLGVGLGATLVVDGVIQDRYIDIDPGDVKDITVLQAPQAQAIFGEKGKNGAIVIVTKNGTAIKYKELAEVKVSAQQITGRLKKSTVTGQLSVLSCGISKAKVMSIDTIKRFFVKPIVELKIYPNPIVKGSTMHIELRLKKPGTFLLNVLAANGLQVFRKQLIADVSNAAESIPISNEWSSGVYFVQVLDENGGFINSSRFVIQ